jgi:hypothetical protein
LEKGPAMDYLDEFKTGGPPREGDHEYTEDPADRPRKFTAHDVAEYHATHQHCSKCKGWFRLSSERIGDLRRSKWKFVCKGCLSPAAQAKAKADECFEAVRQKAAAPGATLADLSAYWQAKAKRERAKK